MEETHEMGTSNEARPLGRADFYFCFNLTFVPADRASCLNIYLYYIDDNAYATLVEMLKNSVGRQEHPSIQFR